MLLNAGPTRFTFHGLANQLGLQVFPPVCDGPCLYPLYPWAGSGMELLVSAHGATCIVEPRAGFVICSCSLVLTKQGLIHWLGQIVWMKCKDRLESGQMTCQSLGLVIYISIQNVIPFCFIQGIMKALPIGSVPVPYCACDCILLHSSDCEFVRMAKWPEEPMVPTEWHVTTLSGRSVRTGSSDEPDV